MEKTVVHKLLVMCVCGKLCVVTNVPKLLKQTVASRFDLKKNVRFHCFCGLFSILSNAGPTLRSAVP